jgi:hypothetical protein
MNPIRHIRRLTAALAGLACAWLGLAVAAPAAIASTQRPPPSWATSPPRILPARALAWIRAHLPPGWNKHPPLPPGHVVGPVYKVPIRTVVVGGMPGWQIALIAIAAALLAATAAVLAYRAWTTRRQPVPTTPVIPGSPSREALWRA